MRQQIAILSAAAEMNTVQNLVEVATSDLMNSGYLFTRSFACFGA